MKLSIGLLIALMLVPPALAAGGSELLNYQGVLRDAGGSPRQGTFDMRFRLFDADAAGNELLIDEHLAAGTGGVVVTGGLFNTALGSGNVLDGSGPGIYLNMTQVFGQLDSVWLEIQVGGETLTPRVPVRSSAYAMNSRLLQGKDSSRFLASDTSDAFTSGTLTLDPGTVLDVNGETHLDGSVFMHHEGPDASQFVQFYDGGNPAGERFGWNDTTDRFTLSNTLNLENNSHLEQTGDAMYLNSSGPDRSQAIYFYDAGEPTGQSIYWDDPTHRFWLSADTTIQGSLTMNDLKINGNQLLIGHSGPDQNQKIGFFDDGVSGNESLLWDNTNDRFQLSNDLYTKGALRQDGDTINLNVVGPDGDQSLRFYEDGLDGGESIQWDDAQDRFEITDDLAIQGVLRTGTTGVAPVAYNTIGSGAATSPDISSILDLFVSGDLEVGDQLYLNDNFYLEYSAASGTLHTSSGLHVGTGLANNLMVAGPKLFLNVGAPGNAPTEYLQFNPIGLFELSDDLDVNGTLTANSKNFVQNHPYDPSLEVVYTTLEGPEASTFTRGSARLVNGQARIALDESFALVTNPDLGLTASLTPRGAAADLYVVEVTTKELVVAAAAGTPRDAKFDYLVLGLHVGYEESPVLRPRTHDAFPPETESLRAQIADRPELKRHTPLARYLKAESEVFGREQVDLSASAALRIAVGSKDAVGSPAPAASPTSSQAASAVQPSPRNAPSNPGASPTPSPAPAIHSTSISHEDEHGNFYARSFRSNTGGLDSLSPVIGTVEPGDVLVVDPAGFGVRRADAAGDVTVVGIATGSPTVDASGHASVPFAVAGIVTCNVDASGGPVRVGDLLVTSQNPGYAERSDAPTTGTVLGKALEALPSGTGTIRVLVVLR